MRVHFVEGRETIAGRLYYVEREASFAYQVEAGGIPNKDVTPSIALGTLEIEVSLESGRLLYASGYCPRESWLYARLTPPLTRSVGVALDDMSGLRDKDAVVTLARVGDWPVEYDSTNGWLRIAREGGKDEESAEIATDVIVGTIEGGIHSLWLHPTFVENYPR